MNKWLKIKSEVFMNEISGRPESRPDFLSKELRPGSGAPRVHIAFRFVDGPYGGGNQFLKALRAELVDRGQYVEDIGEADFVIVNSFHRGQEEIVRNVMEAKRRNPGLFVIHRVDGPYSLVRGRREYADLALIELNKLLADGTVFQSKWSQAECHKQGLPGNKPEVIVSNAPAAGVFAPSEHESLGGRKVRLVASSWSTNPNKGFDTYAWMDANLDWEAYEMTIFGNSSHRFNNIRLVPPLPTVELARELSHFDVFVSAARNEPCSNALIEALHSGLPALVFDGGGSPAILGSAGLVFSSPGQIPRQLAELSAKYEQFRGSIKVPQIAQICDQYIEFFMSLAAEATAGLMDSVQARRFSRQFLTRFAVLKWGVWGRIHRRIKSKVSST